MTLICIDPGHGGEQPGAVYGGCQEKDATLQIAVKLARNLRGVGHGVIMTRDNDATVSLRERCDISNTSGADAFVSIHLNAATAREANGAETWKWPGNKSGLAESVQTELVAAIGAKDRGVKTTSTFYVMKHTRATALVVECGFMSNNKERVKLFDDAYQEKIAAGIARGFLKLYN